jgi:hypothetical protein
MKEASITREQRIPLAAIAAHASAQINLTNGTRARSKAD